MVGPPTMDGTILAAHLDHVQDVGAYPTPSPMTAAFAVGLLFPGPYRVPAASSADDGVADPQRAAHAHLRKVIDAAAKLDVPMVGTCSAGDCGGGRCDDPVSVVCGGGGGCKCVAGGGAVDCSWSSPFSSACGCP